MKLDYKKLSDFFVERPPIKNLSNKLFQLGHEHEIHDQIFDMELTPNRGDCLSLLGLARDLNVFFPNSKDRDIYSKKIPKLEFDFENISPNSCHRISFLEIEVDLVPKKYKSYLNDYFDVLKINRNNFFSDVSNYLSYEMGHPTHCYDKEKITDKLIFTEEQVNEKFKTLLGTEILLSGQNCVFKMGNEVINLAGIIGGDSTSCNIKTKKVLVECAYFNPESIMGKALKYNVTSDAAHKFERGVDMLAQEIVLRRFIKIVEDHTNIKNLKLKTLDYSQYKPQYVKTSVEKINKILGTNIDNKAFIEYLEKLNFFMNEGMIEVPSYRHDIKNCNDIAEEIARIIGYDNIESKAIELPSINKPKQSKVNTLRTFMQTHRFSEVINFPFTNNKSVSSIKIDNPLDSGKSYLRTSLRQSLINNLIYNERRQNDSIKLYEISDIYFKENDTKHETKIGIIASGRQGHSYINFSKKIDKQFFENIFNSISSDLKFNILEIPRSEIDTKIKDKIFYIEANILDIDFDSIQIPSKFSFRKTNFIKYEEISSMPSSSRDISFSVEKPESLKELFDIINNFRSSNLKKSFCFDFFVNPKKSVIKVGFRFIFQSKAHSLNDKEVEKEIKVLIEKTLRLDGIKIPGLEF